MAKLVQRPDSRSSGHKPAKKHAGSKRKSADKGKPIDADTKAIQMLLHRCVCCGFQPIQTHASDVAVLHHA